MLQTPVQVLRSVGVGFWGPQVSKVVHPTSPKFAEIFSTKYNSNSTLRNAAEGEFPARVPSFQPEPKARDATSRVQEHLPPRCVPYF